MAKEAYCWLRGNADPLLYCRDWSHEQMPSQELQDKELTFICSFNRPMLGRHLDQQQRRIAAEFPRWQVWVTAPTRRLAREAANNKVITWSDSLLTRDDFWMPSNDGLHYSAVTVSGWEQYNKHELLEKAERVLLVTPTSTELREREAVVRRLLPMAYFIRVRRLGWLDPESARGYYVQSHTGLCLSDCDGGSRMVSEFQLCGLPIVATRTRAGALTYCDLEFVRILPETPGCIASAIKEFEDEAHDPYAVRNAFLENMLVDRAAIESKFGDIDWTGIPVLIPEVPPEEWSLP